MLDHFPIDYNRWGPIGFMSVGREETGFALVCIQGQLPFFAPGGHDVDQGLRFFLGECSVSVCSEEGDVICEERSLCLRWHQLSQVVDKQDEEKG